MITSGIFKHIHISTPTQDQEKALRLMESFVSFEDPLDFLIVCGPAGTGKTTLSSALVGYLNEQGIEYHICAPTGRAARIISRKAGTTANTIHSTIYSVQTDSETGKVTFKLKTNRAEDPMIYIIDEASMVSKLKDGDNAMFETEQGLLFDLIQFVKSGHENSKIIFIGDQYQLPPINERDSPALNQHFLENTFNLKGKAIELREVKRQEDGSYILSNATSVREAIDKGSRSHPIEGKDSRNIYEAADDYVRNMNAQGYEDGIVIGVSHKANKLFNDLVRQRRHGWQNNTLEKGDLLMCIRNWERKEHKMLNGDHFELQDVAWDHIEEVAGMHFVPVRISSIHDGEEIEDYLLLDCITSLGGVTDQRKEMELRRQRFAKNEVFRESQNPADDRYIGAMRMVYGHAITCNKAQGGEWRKVFINTLGIPTLKWQYTAITRAKDEIQKF